MGVYPGPSRSHVFEPQDHGFLAWSEDIKNTTNPVLNASGSLYVTRIPVPVPIIVSTIYVYVQTAGATLTSGQNLLGLYTSAGVKIAQTADQSTAWTTAGLKSTALTSGPFTLSGGFNSFVYGAVLSVGTTPPVFRGWNVTATVMNANQTGLGSVNLVATGQTTIPATFSSTTQSAFGQWVALS